MYICARVCVRVSVCFCAHTRVQAGFDIKLKPLNNQVKPNNYFLKNEFRPSGRYHRFYSLLFYFIVNSCWLLNKTQNFIWVIRILLGKSVEYRVLLHCHYSQVHFDSEWYYLFRVTSIGLFKNYLYSIGGYAKNLWGNNYTKNININVNESNSLTSWHKITQDELISKSITQSVNQLYTSTMFNGPCVVQWLVFLACRLLLVRDSPWCSG